MSDEAVLARAARVQCVVFDVDGVLTDGRLYLTDEGLEIKAFHSRDGHGMRMLQEQGVRIGIITGRNSQVVHHRMSGLGVEWVYQGRYDKLAAYRELCERAGFTDQQMAFVGDDVMDLPVMRQVGFAVAVQDAHPLVKRQAHWQTPHPGGRGAARDVCELVLQAHGRLDTALAVFL